MAMHHHPAQLLLAVVLALGAALAPGHAQSADSPPRAAGEPLTFVIVHGAWGGGWAFREVERLLRAEGHIVYRPTLTGQGEKVHLAHPDIDLTTHVTDVAHVILWEELQNVVLVGHSYGGMVITGAADRVPDRLRQLIYLDALVPNDGESLFDAFGPQATERLKIVDGFIPAHPGAETKAPPHDVPHPAKTLTQPLVLAQPDALKRIPTSYVLYVPTGASLEQAPFFRFFSRAKDRGWHVTTLESDHNAQWSHPRELAALLLELASR